MALTIAQELEILAVPSTLTGLQDNSLQELVYQTAIGESIRILSTAKDIGDPVDEKASNYLNKVTDVARRVSRNDQTAIDTLRKILVSIIGDSAFTWNQVSGADASAWEGFISDEIDTCFEYLGGVLPAEKQAYTDYVPV